VQFLEQYGSVNVLSWLNSSSVSVNPLVKALTELDGLKAFVLQKGTGMLERKALAKIRYWKENKPKQGLLVIGARQVGKTTLIRNFARENYDAFIEINFFERPEAIALFKGARNTEDLLLRISALSDRELVYGNTLIFFDEIQEFEDILTWAKFLEERTPYDYIFSGSLLGIDAFNIRSWPVGFLSVVEMFPLDFEEFCKANKVTDSVIESARASFEQMRPVPDFIHDKMMDLYRKYLMVGGMPQAVQSFCDSFDLQAVRSIQDDIVALYHHDISKYMKNKTDARFIKTLYDAIPGQLDKENKRYKFKNVTPESSARFTHLETSFDWLGQAGVALPVFRVDEPRYPLSLNENRSAFKLFMNDIGLLTSRIMGSVDLDILLDKISINYGSLYENVVAQELKSQGFSLYYYNSSRFGEIDFVVEDRSGGGVILIEVKSGKNYKRHVALSNLLRIQNYSFDNAFVLYNGNLKPQGEIAYLPVYMASFLGYPAQMREKLYTSR